MQAVVVCACSLSAREAETGDSWGRLAGQLSLIAELQAKAGGWVVLGLPQAGTHVHTHLDLHLQI